MIRITLFLFFFLPSINLFAIETISIKAFGAIPNDGKSDQNAFEKASDYINKKKGNIKLIIPSGLYIVGKQDETRGNYFFSAREIITLKNCSNVEIVGEPGAIIKYGVGLRFGTFKLKDGLSTNITYECGSKPMKSSERAALGHVIQLQNCSNINISQLTLDGNFYEETLNNMNSFPIRNVTEKNKKYLSNKINIGGGYGNCGVQIEHYGILIFHSSNVTINSVECRRFGSDGLLIANVDGKDKNIVVKNSKFDYNSRTGIAIGGGEDIQILNCIISNTGRFFYVATATGIDIEPEDDIKAKNKKVKNVLIDNCTIKGNSEGAVLAKFGGFSENITISNSNIQSFRSAINIGNKTKNFKYLNNTLDGVFLQNEKQIKNITKSKQSIMFNKL